ncbi:CASP-like protein 1E1 [Rutidosis leptorrhynchoides]|uniref:CASP-like protein 1E1 n=1 Tax=Rutidosis leptorrhynchoides TaxID=125765 RepID=UPI003A9926B2
MNEGTAAAGVKDSNSTSNNGSRVMLSYNIVLRTMAFCFTLVAAVVAGVDFETKNIPVTISDQLPPFNIKVTAKWHYLSSTVFLVVANSIACSYSFGSIIVSILSHNKKIQTRLLLLISDLLMVALLFSANGAATSVGLIALNGNPHTQWQKVCNMFKRYCHQGAASIVMSYIGSFAFLWLVVFAIMNLHKKSS